MNNIRRPHIAQWC